LRNRIDQDTRESVSPFVDQMASVSARLGELRGAHQALDSSRRYLAEVEHLQAEREALRTRAGELERELDAAQDAQSIALERVRCF
ncbi:MAG TPA: hypothetical protein VMA77_34040, partial [Solirubrobacteraceae bacterium]|nr:hypothetical protein [Solirubrobacteraceae bacterium]